MKFDDLCSIAHNVADSFGSGVSLLFGIGFYPYDDAERSEDGLLEVDFLNGKVISGLPCTAVRESLSFAPEVISDLCARYGESSDVFATLRVRYVVTAVGRRYEVKVTDRSGRTRIDHYDGIQGSRLAPRKHPPVQSV